MKAFLALLLTALHLLQAWASPIAVRSQVSPRATSNYSALVVFGDSISDNGNGSYKITNGSFPPSFYDNGRFSNGPMWNEYLAANLSIPLYNHAVGGSTTSNTIIQGYTGMNSDIPVPSTDEQVAIFLQNIPYGLDFNTTLFAVTGGVNDITYNTNANAYTSMSVIAECVSLLQKHGAQNFLFLNYYDTSLVPLDTYLEPGVKRDRAMWSETFQTALEQLQRSTAGSHLYSLKTDLLPHFYYYGEPTKYGYDQFGAYGSCATGVFHETANLTICDDPDRYVYWDEYHPTTKTHSYIAAGMLDMLQTRA